MDGHDDHDECGLVSWRIYTPHLLEITSRVHSRRRQGLLRTKRILAPEGAPYNAIGQSLRKDIAPLRCDLRSHTLKHAAHVRVPKRILKCRSVYKR